MQKPGGSWLGLNGRACCAGCSPWGYGGSSRWRLPGVWTRGIWPSVPKGGVAKERHGGDGDGLVLALARRVVSAEQDDAESVEAVFPQARDPEAKPELKVVESTTMGVAGQRARP